MIITCKCGLRVPMPTVGHFPLRCHCGHVTDAPPEAYIPGYNRTLAQLTVQCEECNHYLITEVCSLWSKPNRCQARRRWVHAIAFGRFLCSLGLWRQA